MADQQAKLEREGKDIEKRIARLVAAIETGGDVPRSSPSSAKMEARQRRHRNEAASLQPVPRLAPAVIENRLAEWRRSSAHRTTTADRAPASSARPIDVHANVPTSTATISPAPTRFDKLFTGIVESAPATRRCRPGHQVWRIRWTMITDGCWSGVYAKGVVRPEGIEPPAYRFEACRSIHLSYGRTSKP